MNTANINIIEEMIIFNSNLLNEAKMLETASTYIANDFAISIERHIPNKLYSKKLMQNKLKEFQSILYKNILNEMTTIKQLFDISELKSLKYNIEYIPNETVSNVLKSAFEQTKLSQTLLPPFVKAMIAINDDSILIQSDFSVINVKNQYEFQKQGKYYSCKTQTEWNQSCGANKETIFDNKNNNDCQNIINLNK